MSSVLVSVICTNYNKGPWLRETLESLCVQQTDFSYEVIIVDDCSTDGSDAIIREFASKYSHKVRTFFHDENQGIVKTWVEVCLKARGSFIARCDGDDVWIDVCKLQKQYNLLKINKESRWCNTDFDIVNEDGVLISRSAFQSGVISCPQTIEEMLATKGFTNASTWLVEKTLMLEVNEAIRQSSIDDTFSIQLELFKRTSLICLQESTVAYRMVGESDSHKKDIELMSKRFDGLLADQLYYLDKFRGSLNLDLLVRRLMKSDRDSCVYVEYMKLENERLKVELDRLVNSTSWRLTLPFRKVGSFLRKRKWL